MIERKREVTFPNGVTVIKWKHKTKPTKESVAKEIKGLGYTTYDLQTIDPWFERGMHRHNEPEMRGAVSGVTTFHFKDCSVTIEAGDILFIPAGLEHEVISHNGNRFSAYKCSASGKRHVTECA